MPPTMERRGPAADMYGTSMNNRLGFAREIVSGEQQARYDDYEGPYERRLEDLQRQEVAGACSVAQLTLETVGPCRRGEPRVWLTVCRLGDLTVCRRGKRDFSAYADVFAAIRQLGARKASTSMPLDSSASGIEPANGCSSSE